MGFKVIFVYDPEVVEQEYGRGNHVFFWEPFFEILNTQKEEWGFGANDSPLYPVPFSKYADSFFSSSEVLSAAFSSTFSGFVVFEPRTFLQLTGLTPQSPFEYAFSSRLNNKPVMYFPMDFSHDMLSAAERLDEFIFSPPTPPALSVSSDSDGGGECVESDLSDSDVVRLRRFAEEVESAPCFTRVRFVFDAASRALFLQAARGRTLCYVGVKTTGLSAEKDLPTFFYVCFDFGETWVFPVYDKFLRYLSLSAVENLAALEEGVFGVAEMEKWCLNASFLCGFASACGLSLVGRFPSFSLSLKVFGDDASLYKTADDFLDDNGYVEAYRSFPPDRVPPKVAVLYGAAECDKSFRAAVYNISVAPRDCVVALRQAYAPLVSSFAIMEIRGIAFDEPRMRADLDKMRSTAQKIYSSIVKKGEIRVFIWKRMEKEFNELKNALENDLVSYPPNSPLRKEKEARLRNLKSGVLPPDDIVFDPFSTQHIVELFDALHLGSYPPTDASLERLSTGYALFGNILSYRRLKRMINCCEDVLSHSKNGRVHPQYSLVSSKNLRAYATAPSIQNFPTESVFSFNVRNYFSPPPGKTWIHADFSQMEIKTAAICFGDERLANDLNAGVDVHHRTFKTVVDLAYSFYGTPKYAYFEKDERSKGKKINFSFLYGATEYAPSLALSHALGVPSVGPHVDASMAALRQFFPSFDDFKQNISSDIMKGRPVLNLFGRPRVFPVSNTVKEKAENLRQAVNYVVQSSAFVIALSVMSAAKSATRLPFEIVSVVHDAFVLSVDNDAAGEFKQFLADFSQQFSLSSLFSFEDYGIKFNFNVDQIKTL